MVVEVLFFGVSRDYVGDRLLRLDVDASMTVGLFRHLLETKFPKLSALKRYAVAVNNEYADDEITLHDGDEIAVIPPVSGG